jgi:hypothetical protein
MHDLLIILRNCAIHEPGVGRRDLRPGAIINAREDVARNLIAKGYAKHVVAPAPLFVDSTSPPERPKKKSRSNDDDLG